MCVVSEPVVEDATAETTDDVSEEIAEEVVPVTISDTATATSDAEEVTLDDGDDAVETEPEPVAFPTTPTELAEQYPELAEAVQYQGAQSREAKLRREMGAEASATARLTQYRDHLAANPDDDGTAVKQILQDNRLNVRDELVRTFAKQSADAQGWDQTQIDAMNVTIEQMSGSDLASYANQVINQGLDAREAKIRKELGDESEATVAQRVGEERMADKIESKPKRSDPPATPAGRAPGTGTYGDVSWVQAQMRANPEWAHQMSPDGKTTNLARSRPAIDALAQERRKQRLASG